MNQKDLDELCIKTISLLSVDTIEKAKSGHPGLPMGAAKMAYTLWSKILKHNPKNPEWPNRDRFVLSAGHGSTLLYSLLHLFGYNVSLNDLKNFRQWGSITPGHPEYGLTPGVETTTGPLGQGFANGIGMAIAEAFLSKHFNKPGYNLIDYYTYVICSDGDLMEGITSEAASIAGHLKLNKLICLYDSNHISIEGITEIAFSESVKNRFIAYGWNVLEADGTNIESVLNAVKDAHGETSKPTLIKVNTHIGYGSPHKHDTPGVHGSPLGEEEIKLVKESFGFPADKSFYIPDEVKKYFDTLLDKYENEEHEWKKLFEIYKKEFPEKANEWKISLSGKLPENWDTNLPIFDEETKLATRQASGRILNAISKNLPLLIGGSADLAPSTNTYLKGRHDFGPEHSDSPNVHFGVREHAMGSIINGIALSKQLIPYGATFLIFSDYMKPAIRLAALMQIKSIFIFTHDSIGLGEDGPTHQPIEQLVALRSIPGITVLRPCDANETLQAWKIALENNGPTVIALSRQKLPILDTKKYNILGNVKKGAYVLSDCEGIPDILLLATGSEVHLALSSQEKLNSEGIKSRVISMPSWELFKQQNKSYQEDVLPSEITNRIAIEAASPLGWHEWISCGEVIGINKFGASAPGNIVMDKYGFNVGNVVSIAKRILNKII